jgi:hypothetical protein
MWTDKLVSEMDELVDAMDKRVSDFRMSPDMKCATTTVPDLSVPQFANADFMGNDFAQEATSWYYRTRRIAEVDYRWVRAYLERDSFGPTRLLVRNTIRPLTVKIDWDIFKNQYFGREKFAYDALKDSMDSLRMLQDHRDMTIEIYLHRDLQFCPSLYRILETIRPSYLLFRGAKIDMKVLGYEWFGPMGDGTSDSTSEQLNHYFTRTPEEWLNMQAKEIKVISEAKLWRHCKRVSTSSAILALLTITLDFGDHQSSFRKCRRCCAPSRVLERTTFSVPTVALPRIHWYFEGTIRRGCDGEVLLMYSWV